MVLDRAGLFGGRSADRGYFASKSLVAGLKSGGHRNARAISGAPDIAPIVAEVAQPGDYVIFLGAGNITQWAYALPGELAALAGE